MRLFLSATAFILLSSLALAATYYVPDDFPTIQDAINSSNHYDTIIVRPGTYVENLDFCGMLITVMSEKGPEVTIIDGGNPVNPDFGSVVRYHCGETHGAVLDGFTLTNGKGTYSDGGYWGWAEVEGNRVQFVEYYGISISGTGSPLYKHAIARNNYVAWCGRYGISASRALLEGNVVHD